MTASITAVPPLHALLEVTTAVERGQAITQSY
jgi:hypothetical protein